MATLMKKREIIEFYLKCIAEEYKCTVRIDFKKGMVYVKGRRQDEALIEIDRWVKKNEDYYPLIMFSLD